MRTWMDGQDFEIFIYFQGWHPAAIFAKHYARFNDEVIFSYLI